MKGMLKRFSILIAALVLVVGLATAVRADVLNPQPAQGTACNGGSDTCRTANKTVQCPTSGGPVCARGEKCHCVCHSSGTGVNNITRTWGTNECIKPAGGGNPRSQDIIIDGEYEVGPAQVDEF